MQRGSRCPMGRVAACFLTIVLAMSGTLVEVNGQSEEKIEILNYSTNTTGPVWIEYSCEQTMCHGMELIVNNSGLIDIMSDPHRVEWAGMVQENISWRLLSDEVIDREFIKFDSIISNKTWSEKIDLPDVVPSPSQQEDFKEIETFSGCQMDRCDLNDLGHEGVVFAGTLESLNDKDAIRIVGNKGDVLLLPKFRSSSDMEIEIWMRNEEIKERIESINSGHNDKYYFEYPDGELWLRIISSLESEYSTYEFEIVRYDASKESPDLRELTNPWTHGNALEFNGTYHGHIASSDSEGDSILIELGSKMSIRPICQFSYDILLEIIIHEINSIEIIYLENISSCPEIINSTYFTKSIEFRIKSNFTQPWSIKMSTDYYGDGRSMGDAPDSVWQPGFRDERWEIINNDNGEYFGRLGGQDYVDIYALEIYHENGSKIYFNDTEGDVSFKILVINQTSGAIMNSTDERTIIAPKGIHVIRIEKNNNSSDTVNYYFKAPEIRSYSIDNRELEDLSRLFTNFYIIVGIMFLTPMFIVIWWNRDIIFRGDKNIIQIERHELMMLDRLKNRIVEKIDKEIILSSLHQLGDSPWDSVIDQWGKPALRNMTENLEVCIWKINNLDILLGIKINRYAWNLAAIRIYSSGGESVTINAITPEKIFQEDEIYLDNLKPKSNQFLKITLKNTPANMNFQITGIVNGEPVAVTSNKTIVWEEE